MSNKPIPYFSMEGTVFEVDIENQRLIERANPKNTISFVSDMTDKGTYYTFTYDLRRKNVYDKSNGFYESEDWTQVRVPKLIELDPEGMAKKYGYTVEQLQGKTDFEVIVDQELLAKRLHGALPVIDICGTAYYADVRVQELRAVDEHWNRIDLKLLDISVDNENYIAFYHPESRQAVTIDLQLTALPAGVVMIEIPKDLELDPIAVARQYGMDHHSLLRCYPIQKELKAKSIPLSETGLPELVEKNLRKQEQQVQSKIQRQKRIKNRPRI